MKTFLFRSMVGIFFGAFLAILMTFAVIWFGDVQTLSGDAFIRNSMGSMFCGWFFSVTPLYFEITTLKLWQQTLLHFLTVSLLYFIISFGIGWIPFQLTSALLSILSFLLIYLIIWIGFYFYFRSESKKLNEELNHLQ
ncbi:DUF3021 domain-containing protein [Halobacillus sp. Nhm2S1]|uniref:DUF3021 domain-containing protein n=1 Tax=Halobacillus sp. Nhm2S1 TaxID=2866716 RepID=UPI001C737A3D|nr:DUF3021 domain-containing protein [Halobacillus sp. Nhm2S1]MBX0356994.1 DUF3021 domain-containing protein [Halobacillus sp. Nhm2S1]